MGSHLSLFAGLGTQEWGLLLDGLRLPAASLEGRVRPDQEVPCFKYSHTQKGTRDRCQVCEQLPELAGHCSLEKAEEESDCLGQVGNGS